MMTLQKVCGAGGTSPIAGLNIYQNDILINSMVHFLIVDNIPENSLSPSPDFTFDQLSGTITRTNQWLVGVKAIIVYSKCNSNC